MSDATQQMFTISHTSDISAVRRAGTQLGASVGFDETTTGKLAIIITEAATNILKHAGSGLIAVSLLPHSGAKGVQVLALDKGPGIRNLAQCLRDGISTTGTAGTGLGAMRRLSDDFDVFSSLGAGSAFYMCVMRPDTHEQKLTPQIGAVCVPIAGEEKCGDAWAFAEKRDGIMILVADGLGHGPDAALASDAAVRTLDARRNLAPVALMEATHQALRSTRGAAAALMELHLNKNVLNFVGIGNIACCLIDANSRKQLVSHNGIVGHNMRKVQEFTLPLPRDALCVLCSDGITTQWDLDKYPGLFMRHPALIAGVIYRDFVRGRDDATVVVIRVPDGVKSEDVPHY